MSEVVLTNAVDTYVSGQKSTQNYNLSNRLVVSTGGTGDRIAYMSFSRPFPLGVTIISAKLRVYNDATWAGTVNLTATRIAAKWSVGKVNYSNRPGVTGAGVVVTKTGAVASTLWEFDITAMMQAVSNGGSWYGVRLTADGTALKRLHSAQSGQSTLRPVLDITWSDAPQAPTVLHPSANNVVPLAKPLLSFDFTDLSGDQTMMSAQVQLNATDVWTAPSFDSGEVVTSVPQVDLAATAYAGLASGASIYWRVRVRDGAGIWSTWSGSTQFTYKPRGTVTITSPAASPSNIVQESSPPFSWTFSGVQRAFQVLVYNVAVPNKPIWDSGKITSTALAVTPPDGTIVDPTITYNIAVRVYDDQTREQNNGIPVYAESTRTFTLTFDAATATVTGLTAVPDAVLPTVHLQWSRSATPDQWSIMRDGVEVAKVDGPVLLVTGTTYAYDDVSATARDQHTWSVAAVVNSKTSASNPTANATLNIYAPWLMRPDRSDAVVFLNPDYDPEQTSVQELHRSASSAPPILITQAINGYEGSMSGVFFDDIVSGVTAKMMRDRFKSMRNDPGTKLVLMMVNENINIVAYDMSVRPVSMNSKVGYLATFNFVQV